MFQYSFKSLVGAFSHPLAGLYTFNGGQVGFGQVTITYSTDRSAHDVAADGSVMVSYRAGDNGTCKIEVQQTSDLNNFLISWFNTCKAAADGGDASNWASASVTFRAVDEGVTHILTGVSPSKPPDKTYGAEGAKLSWDLMAANVVTQ